MRILSLPLVAALVAPLAAQGPSYSRFDFGNAYRIDREDAFPNARSTQGNEAGDFAWKAFPMEVLAYDQELRVSGLRISFTVDKSYQGAFPVFVTLPEVAFFPLVRGKVADREFDLPDVQKRASRSLPLPAVNVLRGGIQIFELRLGPNQPDPRLRTPVQLPGRDAAGALQGWAVGLMAPPSQQIGDGKPNFVPVPSFGEIHRQGGPSSFSGLYDARKRAYLPYGTAGAPSNAGELAVELLLDQPTLQVFSDASGGVRNDPKKVETHKGPGAYVNGLATSVVSGYYGLFCQWEGKEGTGLWALPLVTSFGPGRPSQSLRFGDAMLLWEPSRAAALTIYLETGNAGPLAIYKAGGVAGHDVDQRGVFATVRIPFPQDPRLNGLSLWLQALIAEPATARFPAASNLVRVVF